MNSRPASERETGTMHVNLDGLYAIFCHDLFNHLPFPTVSLFPHPTVPLSKGPSAQCPGSLSAQVPETMTLQVLGSTTLLAKMFPSARELTAALSVHSAMDWSEMKTNAWLLSEGRSGIRSTGPVDVRLGFISYQQKFSDGYSSQNFP